MGEDIEIRFSSAYSSEPEPIKQEIERQMISILQAPASPTTGAGMREAPTRIATESGPMVVRRYLRGGMISRFNSSWHLSLRMGKRIHWPHSTRAMQELTLLEELLLHRFNVPTPIAAAIATYPGRLIYRAALCMVEIPGAVNFRDVVVADRTRFASAELMDQKDIGTDLPLECAIDFAEKAGRVAGAICRYGVLHRDLHPGNIMISQGDVYLIDFDRAKRINRSEQERGLWYLAKRWKRSCTKLRLSESLSAAFSRGLQKVSHSAD